MIQHINTIAREKIEKLMSNSKWIYIPFRFHDRFLLLIGQIGSNQTIIIPSSVCYSDSYIELADYSIYLNNCMSCDENEVIRILKIIKDNVKLVPKMLELGDQR